MDIFLRCGAYILLTFYQNLDQAVGNPVLATNSTVQQSSTAALCTSYCDIYGYYQPQKYCISQDGSSVYCCGSENTRYCCSDKDKDVGGLFPNVKHCPNSSYWMYQWRIIMGLLGSLAMMLLLAACCYYCCGSRQPPPSQSRRRGAVRRRDADGVPVPDAHIETFPEEFDPQSPYAFVPPDYDSLPKDPPKYLDIFDLEGHENPAFQEETQETSFSTSDSTVAIDRHGNEANSEMPVQHSTREIEDTAESRSIASDEHSENHEHVHVVSADVSDTEIVDNEVPGTSGTSCNIVLDDDCSTISDDSYGNEALDSPTRSIGSVKTTAKIEVCVTSEIDETSINSNDISEATINKIETDVNTQMGQVSDGEANTSNVQNANKNMSLDDEDNNGGVHVNKDRKEQQGDISVTVADTESAVQSIIRTASMESTVRRQSPDISEVEV